jgi:polyhydroxyalkanoate synthase subunit PhaC
MDTAEATRLAEGWVRELAARLPDASSLDWSELLQGLARHPEQVARLQERYYRLHLELWTELLAHDAASQSEIEAAPGDHRFEDGAWEALPWFRYLKQTYLINARWMGDLLALAELPGQRKRRAQFILKQLIDALAPTNFAATNPEALRLAAQTGGASLQHGMERLRRDFARGRIEMSDEHAFAVGGTLAVTPGAVVYQNAVVQLIQYTAHGARVHEHPLFIVPPFINKYYILDLRPENSFVRYALEQGFQVFIVSWRNIGPRLGALTWADYIELGVLQPLRAIRAITGSETVNTLGFCVGGTLLATALAAEGEHAQAGSLTLLASMLDFSDVGDIGVYIDEDFVRGCEQRYSDGGAMPGTVLASAFSSLRANELVWFFVVNNYLKGKAPRAFDLLHWNSDSANLPGKLYAWYLRNAYLENNLRERGKLIIAGQPLDLSRVHMPAFVLATRDDHIVPWRSAYASAQLLAGRIEFVLGASGHVAGIVNPPGANRREYWLAPFTGASADEWLAGARRVSGSWWPHWAQWLKQWSGGLRDVAPRAGNAQYPPLEPAPGSYVREQAWGLETQNNEADRRLRRRHGEA